MAASDATARPARPGRSAALSLRLLPSWPLLVALAAFARLLGERAALLNDPDTYLHIAAGNWILTHGALPAHDPFSHSLPGAPWLCPEWLAEIVLAASYDALGWAGPILLAAAAFAVAIGLLTGFLLRRLDPLPALIAAIAAAALLQPHALARPHVLALPLLVAWSGLLLASRDDDRRPPYWALPLMALWANLHGSFLFGLALAAFLGGEAVWQSADSRARRVAARRWGGFMLAAIVAALVTPHGISGLIEPLRLTQMPALQASFAEWLSPDFRNSPALEFWILGLLAIGYFSAVRLPPTRLVLVLGLLHMTLQHVRHADLLAIVAPLAIAASLAPVLRVQNATGAPSPVTAWAARLPRTAALPALVLTMLIAAMLAVPTASQPGERADDTVTPAAALTAVQRLGVSGPVFNSEIFGGYLVFRGVPDFIDGRAEMYGNDFLAQYLKAERGDPAALDNILSRYRIGWTLLAAPTAIARLMDQLPGWQRVYADRYAIVHRRRAEPR